MKVKKGWIMLLLVVVVFIFFLSKNNALEDIQGLVSQKDYVRLVNLEKEFCEKCRNQDSIAWFESNELHRIVEERNEMMSKYKIKKFILWPITFSWVCRQDPRWGEEKCKCN